MQRLRSDDEESWRCRIIPQRAVVSASQSSNSSVLLKLAVPGDSEEKIQQELEVDYVFTATGYKRNAHEDMLSEVRDLLNEENRLQNNFPVARDYRVCYDEKKVDEKAGVWLQGCNEGTHGVSYLPHLTAVPSSLFRILADIKTVE